MAHTGQIGDQTQSDAFMKSSSYLTILISFSNDMQDWWRKDCGYCLIGLQQSPMTKSNIKLWYQSLILFWRLLLEKLSAHSLGGGIVHWIENWLVGQAQKIIVNKIKSSWQTATSGISQGSVLVLFFFNILIKDLGEGIKFNLFMFSDGTKLGGSFNLLEDRKALQVDLDRLDRPCPIVCMVFSKAECHHLSRNNSIQQYRLGK